MRLVIQIVDIYGLGIPEARVYIDYAGYVLMNDITDRNGEIVLNIPETELLCTLWRVRKEYYLPVELEFDYINLYPPIKRMTMCLDVKQ